SNVNDIGKLAAKKFKKNPQKKQKLESLSPHWLRHLSASHQDLAGISGTMIQENHRHGSYSATQIYLHAPDEMRAQFMNKMHMVISPKLYPKEEEIGNTEIELSLVGSSIRGVDSLIRLIASIENNVLVDFKWS
ncbi:MAG: hypothetical protein ACR2HS_01140, partial [Gammaproteobacteria bacterium]